MSIVPEPGTLALLEASDIMAPAVDLPAPNIPPILVMENTQPVANAQGRVNVAALTWANLQSNVNVATARWTSVGLTGQVVDAMAGVQFVVTDLPGSPLGLAAGSSTTSPLSVATGGLKTSATSSAASDAVLESGTLESSLGYLSWLYDFDLMGNGNRKSKKNESSAADTVFSGSEVWERIHAEAGQLV
jgi:hypothetical protein